MATAAGADAFLPFEEQLEVSRTQTLCPFFLFFLKNREVARTRAFSEGCPDVVTGDKECIIRTLKILLKNSVKVTAVGSIEVRRRRTDSYDGWGDDDVSSDDCEDDDDDDDDGDDDDDDDDYDDDDDDDHHHQLSLLMMMMMMMILMMRMMMMRR